MSNSIADPPQQDSGSFRKVVDVFLSGEGLPLADILSAERIQRIFAKHGCQFGLYLHLRDHGLVVSLASGA